MQKDLHRTSERMFWQTHRACCGSILSFFCHICCHTCCHSSVPYVVILLPPFLFCRIYHRGPHHCPDRRQQSYHTWFWFLHGHSDPDFFLSSWPKSLLQFSILCLQLGFWRWVGVVTLFALFAFSIQDGSDSDVHLEKNSN